MADTRMQKLEGRLQAPRRRLNLVDEGLLDPQAEPIGAANAQQAVAAQTAPADLTPAASPDASESAADDGTTGHGEAEASAATEDLDSSVETGSPATTASTKRRTPSSRKQAAAETAGPGTAPVRRSASKSGRVPLKVDEDLRSALGRAARDRDCTFAEVVFDAIEEAAAAKTLGDIVVEHLPETRVAPARPDALFARPVSRRAQPKVTIELRMTSADRKVLDLLVKQHKAESRTQLIIAALRAHLGTTV